MHIAFSSIVLIASPALGLVYGNFDSQEVRAWDSTAPGASKIATFPAAFTAAPSFAIGLTGLNVSNAENIRVSAYAANVTKTSASIHLDTWSGSTMHSAAAVWLAISSGDPSFQTGGFSTTDDHPWDQPKQNTSRAITFARPYAAPPAVIVWLKLVDLDHTKTWRVSARASDVTGNGFTLHVDTWGDSVLYGATAQWIAYPAGMAGVASGAYSTHDVRSGTVPQLVTNGTARFPTGAFQCDPTVLLALNYIDVGATADLRLRASADPVSHSGMTWHLDGWGDSVIYGAGAAYLALAPT